MNISASCDLHLNMYTTNMPTVAILEHRRSYIKYGYRIRKAISQDLNSALATGEVSKSLV
jgi:hypothetical protein